jgi:hypothetical protein
MTPKRSVNLERTFTPSALSIEKLILHYFGFNPYYAMARSTASEVSYSPVKKALTEDVVKEHLKGAITLGAYQLDQSNNVMWLGWDVDSTDRAVAKEYVQKIVSRLTDIPHVVEFSGSKGYHILVFLSRPMPAAQAKQVVDFVRDAEGLPKTGSSHVECYPKQATLSVNQPMGSLLKIPLGVHPKTHNRSFFIDTSNGWEEGHTVKPEELMVNVVDPDKIIALVKTQVDAKKLLVELLVPHWQASSGEHHNFALYLSGYLAHLGWGLDDTKDLIKDIAIKCGDQEIHNRVQAVTDTYRAVKEGRSVRGFGGLNEILPGATVQRLSELAASVITPTLVKQIDAVRLNKGAAFTKTRAASQLIWADLNEHGEVVQTGDNVAYWFDGVNHLLLPLQSERWQAKLHHDYGLNPADSFGSQVTEEIRLKAISEARIVDVKNRTVWDGEKLFINLGGAAVFVLDGSSIDTQHNGTCGYLFVTHDHTVAEVVPDFSHRINIWKTLVDDISFSKSADAPATPEEQSELLKAWILAFFFQELLPTKPLLLAMGVPGSGKTTAMRRLLMVLESTDSEVLEVVGDKPDSLRASITSHRLLVLDNLEKTGAKWLVDTLNRLATGANIEIRQLYSTNKVYTLRPNCFVALTAVSMPFSEETLFSRILPLEMQQLANPLPEHMLQGNLRRDIGGMWADLLIRLNQIVATLKRDKTQQPPIASRLADFTVFCKRIEKSGVVNGATLIRGLRSLVDRQKLALLASSPFVNVLEEAMNDRNNKLEEPHTFAELFNMLEPIARSRKLNWRWSNSTALARHIQAMAEPLKKLYRAEIADTLDEGTGKTVQRIKFPQS